MVLMNLKITIQGLVLNLSAVELSSLLQNRHYRFFIFIASIVLQYIRDRY